MHVFFRIHALFCDYRKESAMKTRVALIGIIVEDMTSTEALNNLLHEYSTYIIGRMGVPYRSKKICVISIIIDASNDIISSLSGKIGKLNGINVKTMYSKVESDSDEQE